MPIKTLYNGRIRLSQSLRKNDNLFFLGRCRNDTCTNLIEIKNVVSAVRCCKLTSLLKKHLHLIDCTRVQLHPTKLG